MSAELWVVLGIAGIVVFLLTIGLVAVITTGAEREREFEEARTQFDRLIDMADRTGGAEALHYIAQAGRVMVAAHKGDTHSVVPYGESPN